MLSNQMKFNQDDKIFLRICQKLTSLLVNLYITIKAKSHQWEISFLESFKKEVSKVK